MKKITVRALTFFLLLAMVILPVGQQSTFYVHANEENVQVEVNESDSQATEEVDEKSEATTDENSDAEDTASLETTESDKDDAAAEETENTAVSSSATENNSHSQASADTTSASTASTTVAQNSLATSSVMVASSSVSNVQASITATTTPENNSASSESNEATGTSPATTTVAQSALATSSQTVASSSVVGQNASTTSATTTTIVTGTALAMANVLNIVNTNLVNSTGEIIFSNLFEDQTGGIDFRNTSATACQFLTCGNSNGVEVRLLNDAYIRNAIVLGATTGNNLIDGANNDVNGSINTGDAFAGLNLINVANTNFIDSNYLLVTLNAFSNLHGDIVFPGFANFFNQPTSMKYAESTSAIYNDGLIENNLAMETQTGNNQTNNSNGSTINSGTASATSNIFNQLNSSLLGGNSVSILLRVHGSWLGEVFGMPEGMNLNSGNDGYYYISDTSYGTSTKAAFAVNASNTAAIYNDVSLSAVTGNNVVTDVNDATITTGNAYVGANLINIANANVIGRNWTMAIINIFGDFDGNISFGQPNLWVGEQVEVPSTVNNGSELTYVYTVINKGDATATNVVLSDIYDSTRLEIIDASLPYTKTDTNAISWELSDLAPGEVTEISYRTRVVNTTPGNSITNTVEITLRETDGNYIDNTDTATIQTTQVTRNSSATRTTLKKTSIEQNTGESSKQAIEKIKVGRLTSAITLDPYEYKAVQELVIQNPQNLYIKDVVLRDLLYSPDGLLLKEEIWEIGDVLPYEEITLSYEMEFADNAIGGMYKLTTVVTEAEGGEKIFANNGQIELLTQGLVEEVFEEVPTVGFAKSNFTPQPVVLGTTTSKEAQGELDEFSLTSPFSTQVAYADNNDETQKAIGLSQTELYQLLFLPILLLVFGFYRYLLRSRAGNKKYF